MVESASEDANGIITVTLTNNSLEAEEAVEICLTKDGGNYAVCETKVVTGVMNAHNTFEMPEIVTEQDFAAYETTECGILAKIPACSVVSIRLKKQN